MLIRNTNKFLIPPIVALAAVLLKGPTAHAVQAPPDRSAPRPQEVSDQELRAFTGAAVEINQIQAFYQLAIAQAAKTLADQANAKIRGTLDKRQVTVDEFDRILQALERDPSLREKARRIARDEADKRGKRRAPPPSALPSEPAPPPSEDLPPPGEITMSAAQR